MPASQADDFPNIIMKLDVGENAVSGDAGGMSTESVPGLGFSQELPEKFSLALESALEKFGCTTVGVFGNPALFAFLISISRVQIWSTQAKYF